MSRPPCQAAPCLLAEVYGGDDHDRRRYKETDPVNPLSPYAVSKAASELIVRQYGISHGLRYVIVRPSNHTGPGRSERFVLSGWAKNWWRYAAASGPRLLPSATWRQREDSWMSGTWCRSMPGSCSWIPWTIMC